MCPAGLPHPPAASAPAILLCRSLSRPLPSSCFQSFAGTIPNCDPVFLAIQVVLRKDLAVSGIFYRRVIDSLSEATLSVLRPVWLIALFAILISLRALSGET
jgi:hypothetical protein